VTGLSNLEPALIGKRLELLKEAVPGISRVAAIWNPTGTAAAPIFLRATETAARTLGIEVLPLEVREPEDFAGAFEAAREHADAVVIINDHLTAQNTTRIGELAARYGLPAVGSQPQARAGLLIAYGPNPPAQFRRGATYVDKILKGAKPADLP